MTLAELVTRVREKVDEATAAFWTDTVITNQINESYRYYWAFILKVYEGYFNKTVNISFDGNAAGTYTISTDVFRTRLVQRLLSNEKVPLTYKEIYDTATAKTLSNSISSLPTYDFLGAKIRFTPAPDFTETDAVEIEISKLLTDLSASQDTDSEYPALALDCVVLRATIKCKAIEEMISGTGVDTAPFVADLMTTEQMLKELLEQRTVQRVDVEPFGIEE
jgi:hypothetical protein